VIRPLFLGWSDDGSGISRFHVEVFYMQPSGKGDQLEPVGKALHDSVADVKPSEVNRYQFTVEKSGVYSIVLSTYDHANNSVTARKIFNYLKEPSYTASYTAPVFIREANPTVNHSFIVSQPYPKEVTLDWTGRFKPHELYSKVLSKRVRPLSHDAPTIDDNFNFQFGQRSINAVENHYGILYTVQYLVDPMNSGLQAESSDTNTTAAIDGEMAKLRFHEPLKNGDTIVVWLTATGLTGNQAKYQLRVGVDSTKANVSHHEFEKNGVNQYTSRFV
jgi:hypothetical protein